MKQEEVAAVLAALPPDAEVTVTVKLRDWLAAIQANQGGPEYADAAEVSRLLGFSPAYWAKRARAGKIAGAVQAGDGGRWKLPVAACREHIRGMKRPRPEPAPSRDGPSLSTGDRGPYAPRGSRNWHSDRRAAEAAERARRGRS